MGLADSYIRLWALRVLIQPFAAIWRFALYLESEKRQICQDLGARVHMPTGGS